MLKKKKLLQWFGSDTGITLGNEYDVSDDGNFCADDGTTRNAGLGKWLRHVGLGYWELDPTYVDPTSAVHYHDEIVVNVDLDLADKQVAEMAFDIYDPSTFVEGHTLKKEESFSRFRESFFKPEETYFKPEERIFEEDLDSSKVKYDDIPNQTAAQAAKWSLSDLAREKKADNPPNPKYDGSEDHLKEDQALRYNTGKSQLSYMLEADVAMKGMCAVFEFGAMKYARNNWKKGLPVNEILDSLLRHMTAIANGEIIDPESKLPHIDHITCNAVFLATFGERYE
jgi:hypothetical protein